MYVKEINNNFTKVVVTKLRSESTGKPEFTMAVANLTRVLVYEFLREATVKEKTVQTPVASFKGAEFQQEYVLVAILRAGLGMLAAAQEAVPLAASGFIGMRRNEVNFNPEDFWVSLPQNLAEKEFILLDPMIATGGSALAALRFLREKKAKKVTLLSILAAPEGIAKIADSKLCNQLFTINIDQKLNKQGYIVPGLGDAGDRLFGIREG